MTEAFENTGPIPTVADDNESCSTCGKVHSENDHEHSEEL